MKETVQFSHDDVVKYHLKSQLPTDLVDVIPRINTTKPWQLKIMATWEEHFQSQRIPYAITERMMRRSKHHGLNRYQSLWKESRETT